eukprot:11204967-Lingulodinium_polyedra.AAC.1
MLMHVDDLANRNQLVQYCACFLSLKINGPGADNLPEVIRNIQENACSLFRGIVAVCDPTPGRFEATSEDVNFLSPLGGTPSKSAAKAAPASLEVILSRGKALSRIVTRSVEWKALIQEYRRFSGATVELGPVIRSLSEAVQEHADTLKPTVREASLAVRVACIEAIANKIKAADLPILREKLRSMATKQLEAQIFDVAKSLWQNMDRRNSIELSLLEKL